MIWTKKNDIVIRTITILSKVMPIMSHKSTDLSQHYDMTMISSADILWKRAVCVANKGESNLLLTDASKYD